MCVLGGGANSGCVGDSLKSADALAAWLKKLSIKLHLYPELNTLTPLNQGSVGEHTINCLCSRPTY